MAPLAPLTLVETLFRELLPWPNINTAQMQALYDTVVDLSVGSGSAPSNFSGIVAPDADNDEDDSANASDGVGFQVGSIWIDTVGGEAYKNLDATDGAAVWINTTLSTDELGDLALENAPLTTDKGGTGAIVHNFQALSADLLTNLNAIISDATLIDTGDSRLSDDRDPNSHDIDDNTRHGGVSGFTTDNLIAFDASGLPSISSVLAAWFNQSVVSGASPTFNGENISGIITGDVDQVHLAARKASAGTIPLMRPVYLVGYNPSGFIEVEEADNSDPNKMQAIGITEVALTNSSTEFVAIQGRLTGLDTSAYSEVDKLYVGTATALTATKPTGTAEIQKIASVARSHASAGTLVVFGAGRVNDLPNIANTKVWIGNGSGVPTETVLNWQAMVADSLANLNAKISDATLIDTADARLSDNRDPNAHASEHTDGTDDIQSATNAQKGVATAAQITALEAATAAQHAQAHDLAGGDHNADTLANLNTKISDATLEGVETTTMKSLVDYIELAGGANVPLTGIQTVGGEATVTGDRVFLGAQTTPPDNGVYVTNDAGAWARSADWPVGADAEGWIFFVRAGNNKSLYEVRGFAPVIGTGELDITSLLKHNLGLGTHTSSSLSALNSVITDATLDDSGASRPPLAHDLAGSEHNADTLVDLNSKISDANLLSREATPSKDHIYLMSETVSITLSGDQDVDSVSSGNAKKIGCFGQATDAENGVYISNSGGAWARDPDWPVGFNTDGWTFLVDLGTVQGGKIFVSVGASIIGTDDFILSEIIQEDDARLTNPRTPTAHDIGGSLHNADTLLDLNSKVNDGTLVGAVFSQDTNGYVTGPTAADVSGNNVLQADGDWVANGGSGGGDLAREAKIDTANGIDSVVIDYGGATLLYFNLWANNQSDDTNLSGFINLVTNEFVCIRSAPDVGTLTITNSLTGLSGTPQTFIDFLGGEGVVNVAQSGGAITFAATDADTTFRVNWGWLHIGGTGYFTDTADHTITPADNITVDRVDGEVQDVILNRATTTVNVITNLVNGAHVLLHATSDGTVGRLIVFSATGVEYVGGVAPIKTSAANSKDTFRITKTSDAPKYLVEHLANIS